MALGITIKVRYSNMVYTVRLKSVVSNRNSLIHRVEINDVKI